VPLKLGRWWNNKEEIDLVAFDENIAFIECKWQNSVDKERIKRDLIKKSLHLKNDKKAEYLVLCKNDFV